MFDFKYVYNFSGEVLYFFLKTQVEMAKIFFALKKVSSEKK